MFSKTIQMQITTSC